MFRVHCKILEKMAILEVPRLSSSNVGMSLVMCLCWYLLVIGADSQRRTDPNEGSCFA